MRTWQLRTAKSRFSEVLDLAVKEGPQLVTRRGEEVVVVLSAMDCLKLTAPKANLLSCLLNAPRGGALALDRPPQAIRRLATLKPTQRTPAANSTPIHRKKYDE